MTESDRIRALREAAKRKMRQWRQPCWFPEVREQVGPPTASKFGGAACLLRGEDWPTCPQCGKPMPLFVQVNIAEVPPGARERGAVGVVQFFRCTGYDCEVWPNSETAYLARRIPTDNIQAASSPPPHSYPEQLIVGWREDEDYAWEEADVDLTDEEFCALFAPENPKEGFPRPGDKLFGWPNWIQGESYPPCPECGEPMTLNVFQIDSEDHLPYMFGDCGNCHLCLCPKHPHLVGVTWSTH